MHVENLPLFMIALITYRIMAELQQQNQSRNDAAPEETVVIPPSSV